MFLFLLDLLHPSQPSPSALGRCQRLGPWRVATPACPLPYIPQAIQGSPESPSHFGVCCQRAEERMWGHRGVVFSHPHYLGSYLFKGELKKWPWNKEFLFRLQGPGMSSFLFPPCFPEDRGHRESRSGNHFPARCSVRARRYLRPLALGQASLQGP